MLLGTKSRKWSSLPYLLLCFSEFLLIQTFAVRSMKTCFREQYCYVNIIMRLTAIWGVILSLEVTFSRRWLFFRLSRQQWFSFPYYRNISTRKILIFDLWVGVFVELIKLRCAASLTILIWNTAVQKECSRENIYIHSHFGNI